LPLVVDLVGQGVIMAKQLIGAVDEVHFHEEIVLPERCRRYSPAMRGEGRGERGEGTAH
jgi:hypothetical protein